MSGETVNAETSLAPRRVPLLPEAAILLERSHVNVLGGKVESFNDVVRHAKGDLLMIVEGLAVSSSIKERAREDPVGLDEWFEAHPYHESDDMEKDSAVRLAVCYLHRLAIICTMKELGEMEQVAVELYRLGRAIENLYSDLSDKPLRAGLRITHTGQQTKCRVADRDWEMLEKRVRELMRINNWIKASACESVAKEFTEGIGLFSYNRGLAKKTIKASYLDRHVFTWQTSLRKRE